MVKIKNFRLTKGNAPPYPPRRQAYVYKPYKQKESTMAMTRYILINIKNWKN